MKVRCYFVYLFSIYTLINYADDIKGVSGQKPKYNISNFFWNDTKFYSYFNSYLKWPNATIWYDINPHLTEEMVDAVYSAVEYINSLEEVCVRWKQRPPFSRGWVSKDWVTFVPYMDTPSQPKCFANLGWTGGGRNYIYIGINCASSWLAENKVFVKYVVLHEMMHTMGLRHEHSRPDRDCYIYIDPYLAGAQGGGQLSKMSGKDFPSGFPFDLSSILHYLKDPEGALKAHYSDSFELGRTDGTLSSLDIYKLEHLYCGAPSWCKTMNSPNFCEHMYDFAASDPKCWREGDAYSHDAQNYQSGPLKSNRTYI